MYDDGDDTDMVVNVNVHQQVTAMMGAAAIGEEMDEDFGDGSEVLG